MGLPAEARPAGVPTAAPADVIAERADDDAEATPSVDRVDLCCKYAMCVSRQSCSSRRNAPPVCDICTFTHERLVIDNPRVRPG